MLGSRLQHALLTNGVAALDDVLYDQVRLTARDGVMINKQ